MIDEDEEHGSNAAGEVRDVAPAAEDSAPARAPQVLAGSALPEEENEDVAIASASKDPLLLVQPDAAPASPKAADGPPPPQFAGSDEEPSNVAAAAAASDEPLDDGAAATTGQDATDDDPAPAVAAVATGAPEGGRGGHPDAAPLEQPPLVPEAGAAPPELADPSVEADLAGPVPVVEGEEAVTEAAVEEADAAELLVEEEEEKEEAAGQDDGERTDPAVAPAGGASTDPGPSEGDAAPDPPAEAEPVVDLAAPAEEDSRPKEEEEEETPANAAVAAEEQEITEIEQAEAVEVFASLLEGFDEEIAPPSEPIARGAPASVPDDAGEAPTDSADDFVAAGTTEVAETMSVPEHAVKEDGGKAEGALAQANVSAPSAGAEEAGGAPEKEEVALLVEPSVKESSDTAVGERQYTYSETEPMVDVTSPEAAMEAPVLEAVGETVAASAAEESLAPVAPAGEPDVVEESPDLDTTKDSRSADAGATTPVTDPTTVESTVAKEATPPPSPKKLNIPAAFLGASDAGAGNLSPKGGPSLSPVRKLAVPTAFAGGAESKVATDLTPPELGTPKKLAIPTAFGGDSGKCPVAGRMDNADLTPPELGTPKRLVIPSAFGGDVSKSPVKAHSPVSKSPKSEPIVPASFGAKGNMEGKESAKPVKEEEPAPIEQDTMDVQSKMNVTPVLDVASFFPHEGLLSENVKGLQEQDVSEERVAIETEYVPDPSPSPSRLQIPPAFSGSGEEANSEEQKSPRTASDGSPRKLVIPAAFAGAVGIADQEKPVQLVAPTPDPPAASLSQGGSPAKPQIPPKQDPPVVEPLPSTKSEDSASPGAKQTKSELLREIQRVEEEMAAVKARTLASSGDLSSTEAHDASGPFETFLPNPGEDEAGIEQTPAIADAAGDAETFANPSTASVVSRHSDPGDIPVVPHYSVALPVIRSDIDSSLDAPEDEVEESSPAAQDHPLTKLAPPPLSVEENLPKAPETSASTFVKDADAETATASETTPEKAAAVSPSTVSAKVDSPLPSPTNSEPVLSNCGSCILL